jgi:hypothetical protein
MFVVEFVPKKHEMFRTVLKVTLVRSRARFENRLMLKLLNGGKKGKLKLYLG